MIANDHAPNFASEWGITLWREEDIVRIFQERVVSWAEVTKDCIIGRSCLFAEHNAEGRHSWWRCETPSAMDRCQSRLPRAVVEISPIATPDLLQWAPQLPKTRSGKIMRRILRKIAENTPDQLGDTSTLADPGVVQDLVSNRLNK